MEQTRRPYTPPRARAHSLQPARGLADIGVAQTSTASDFDNWVKAERQPAPAQDGWGAESLWN